MCVGKIYFMYAYSYYMPYMRQFLSAANMRRREIAYCAAVVVYCLLDEEKEREEREREKRHRTMWTREIFLKRQNDGIFVKLNGYMRNNDPEMFRNFVRMCASDFDDLVQLVKPHIEKRDTNYRKAICPSERLAITLRYLATG